MSRSPAAKSNKGQTFGGGAMREWTGLKALARGMHRYRQTLALQRPFNTTTPFMNAAVLSPPPLPLLPVLPVLPTAAGIPMRTAATARTAPPRGHNANKRKHMDRTPSPPSRPMGPRPRHSSSSSSSSAPPHVQPVGVTLPPSITTPINRHSPPPPHPEPANDADAQTGGGGGGDRQTAAHHIHDVLAPDGDRLKDEIRLEIMKLGETYQKYQQMQQQCKKVTDQARARMMELMKKLRCRLIPLRNGRKCVIKENVRSPLTADLVAAAFRVQFETSDTQVDAFLHTLQEVRDKKSKVSQTLQLSKS